QVDASARARAEAAPARERTDAGAADLIPGAGAIAAPAVGGVRRGVHAVAPAIGGGRGARAHAGGAGAAARASVRALPAVRRIAGEIHAPTAARRRARRAGVGAAARTAHLPRRARHPAAAAVRGIGAEVDAGAATV